MGVSPATDIQDEVCSCRYPFGCLCQPAPWGVYSGLNAGVYSGLNAYTGLNTGVIPYTGLNAGLLPYAHRAVAPVAVNAVPIDGGYPYTDALGFSTGLTNVGARVPLTYGAVGAYAHHLPISTTVVKA